MIPPLGAGRSQGQRAAVWAVLAVWLLLVPVACLVLGLLLARQRAQEIDLATEAARSAGEFATVSYYLHGPAHTATLPIDLPATWAAAPTTTAAALPSATPTPTAAAPAAARDLHHSRPHP